MKLAINFAQTVNMTAVDHLWELLLVQVASIYTPPYSVHIWKNQINHFEGEECVCVSACSPEGIQERRPCLPIPIWLHQTFFIVWMQATQIWSNLCYNSISDAKQNSLGCRNSNESFHVDRHQWGEQCSCPCSASSYLLYWMERWLQVFKIEQGIKIW